MPISVKPEVEQDQSRHRERFPLNMLALAVILTAAVLLMSLWSVYRLERVTGHIAESYTTKQKVIDYVESLRQRATLAVKRAISSEDYSFWQNRYESRMTELDEVLVRAVELSGKGPVLQSARQLIEENKNLKDIERRVFSLVKRQELSEARKLLIGTDYLQSSQGYNKSSRTFKSDIEDVIERRIETFRRFTFIITIVGAFAFIIALAAWAIVTKAIRSWHSALSRESEALRQSRERYRLVNQATNDIIWDWDIQTDQLDWNEAVEHALGQNRDELSPDIRSWYDHIHPEDRNRVTESIHEAIDSEESTWTDEYRFGPAQGPWRTYLDRGIIARDNEGRPYRMVGSMLDLTERHNFEEALRASEAKFRSIFEQAALGIGRVRFADAAWIDVNDAFCQMLGYTRQELLNTPWPKITHPEDIEKDLTPFKRMAAGELDSYSVEKRFIHKEGQIVWARLTLSLVRDAEGRPDYEIGIVENITSRKEAQQLLQRYELLARRSRDIIIVVNRENGKIEEANQAAVNAYGRTRKELLNMTVYDLRAPDTRDLTVEQMAEANGAGILFETKHLRKDGSSFPVEVSSQSAYIDGTHTLVSVIRDISERKRIEEQLRESENLFREAFAYAPTGMALTDIEGRFQQVNRAYCELTGYRQEELLTSGISFRDLTHPEDLSENIKEIERMLAGEIPASFYEKRYIRKDKKITWVLASVTARRDENGKPYQIVAIVEDITERKRAEQRLKENEERINAILEQLPLGVGLLEPDGRFSTSNAQMREFVDHIMPSHDHQQIPRWKAFDDQGSELPPDQWPGARALRGEPVSPGVEFLYNPQENRQRWFLESAVPFTIEGRPQAIVVINEITQRKNSEKQREELLGSLQEKTSEMERFTSLIRHDFANPVISIQGFTDELVHTCKDAMTLIADQPVDQPIKERITSLLGEDVDFAKSFIEDAVKQLNTMLDGLRQVAAVGRVPVNIQPLDMNDLIKNLTITMSTQLKNADAELTTADLPPCKGDLEQLKQVFGNLVTNALKYKHPDRTPKIRISGQKQQSRCIYSVEDNGMGIEPHNQPKVFEMFYRVDPSHPAPGDGMGLSIVAKILERHNGKIWVESQPEKGSKFYISLPT